MKPLTLVIALAVLAAGIGLFVFNDQQNKALAEECPGHWHSGITFFVNDARVNFNHASFESPASGHAHHMHPVKDAQGRIVRDDGVYHFHPGRTECIPLTAVGKVLDFSLTDDSLTMGAKHPLAGTYTGNATHQLKVFYDPKGSDDWSEVAWSDVSGDQMKNGDRILVTYGALTPDMIAAQKAQATDMSKYVPNDV
ncbi:MAG: hypothetical protein AABX89_00325 [Candidatus Thermoplasmatota archaeon]